MPRVVPESRFKDLLECATREFIAQGYRRTQMADVASAMSLGKGTLYGYVESKEALFALCLQNADSGKIERPASLPVPTPPPGELARQIADRIAAAETPVWSAAMRVPRAADPRAELAAVVLEFYDLNERNHRSIKLIDRCHDHPELGLIWQKTGREAIRQQIADYLTLRIEGQQLRRVEDVRLAARFIIETVATWAIHIKWDHSPENFDPEEARENAIHFLVEALAFRTD